MYGSFGQDLTHALQEIRDAGLYKHERQLSSPQSAHVTVARPGAPPGQQARGQSGDQAGEHDSDPAGVEALNFCANNYLGLANHPDVIAAAQQALHDWGFGMASVRFICGTQTLHTQLERTISDFLQMPATIAYSSCFDANGGLFEVLFGEQDAVISDELNHASLIDGIRLCKARRLRYRNADLADLDAQLTAAADARRRVVVTDGVFSMDGSYAPLDGICELAERHDALVMVDDSHAVGFVGDHGRGTPELFGVQSRVDIITGTLGKALGGASGGYVSASHEIVELLRQRSRPYLFSNALAPCVAAGSMAAIGLARDSARQREVLQRNTALFRTMMTDAGFALLPGTHPITPVMFTGDDGARIAARTAEVMLAEGVYVVAFSYPVVPRGKARIRVQLSAAHTTDDVCRCVESFTRARAAVAEGR